MSRAEAPVRAEMPHANNRTRLGEPQAHVAFLVWGLVVDTADRYRGIEKQIGTCKPAGDGYRRAGLGQAVPVDERQNLEVGFPHCLRDRPGIGGG